MTVRERLIELLESGGERVELDRAALLIAAEEYPSLEIESYLGKIDALAERVDARLRPDAGPHETLTRMKQVLVDEDGFTGNEAQYHDPRNSFLNDVLDRKLGIPITLSTLYIEVGRRVGFALLGVGFPGHFLVKHAMPGGQFIVVDPFHGGALLDEEDLRAQLDASFGGRVLYEPALLDSIAPRRLLFRMLSNLKAIYIRERDIPRALSVVERMLLLEPNQHGERRDRGVLLARLERPLEALKELAQYRQDVPDGEDDKEVDELMEQLRLKVGMTN